MVGPLRPWWSQGVSCGAICCIHTLLGQRSATEAPLHDGKQAVDIPHGTQNETEGDRRNDEPDDDEDGDLGSLAQFVPLDDFPLLVTVAFSLALAFGFAFRFAGIIDQSRVAEALSESEVEE